jgi:DNA-binding transcriptional MerR regulator
MPIILDGDEYMTISEAVEYLDVNREQLKFRASKLGIKQYWRELMPKYRYYRKTDLDRLRAFRPVEPESEPSSK